MPLNANHSPMQEGEPGVTNLKLRRTIHDHSDKVWCVSYGPDGTLGSASSDLTCRLYKPSSHERTSTLADEHTKTIRTLTFSANLIATASFDGKIGIWDCTDGEWTCFVTLEGHENECKGVAFSSNGNLLATCSRDKSVWIWTIEDGGNEIECLSVLQKHEGDVKCVLWHPTEELLVSASYDNTIRLWKEIDDDWECDQVLSSHTSTVWCVTFFGDDIISCSNDSSIKRWRRKGPGSKYELLWTEKDAHSRTIFWVSVSPYHSFLASCSADNSIRIWQMGESGLDLKFEKPDAHEGLDVNCVRWSSLESEKFELASCGDDEKVRIWQLEGV